MSVILTSHIKASAVAGPAMAANRDPALKAQIPTDQFVQGLQDAANAFAHTYWVAWVLVLLTLIPAAFLPRRQEEVHLMDDEGLPPVVLH